MLLTLKEVAEIFKVSKQTIRRWVKRSDFPAPIQIAVTRDKAATIRWRKADIEKLIENAT